MGGGIGAGSWTPVGGGLTLRRTDELVEDPKMITKNYLKGRFWVDLVASCNFDLIFLVLAPDMEENAFTSLFGMLKLVRLLRLGRMVTYLSKSKSAKTGA